MKIPVPWVVGLTAASMVIFIVLQDELGFWISAVALFLGCTEMLYKKEKM
ncbi:MAG: hypothetical protein HUU50_11305 [Candidatus Brocadiae bacterium]|nr:hypothetical protein [Candidatus Brocadiia bacterium]